MNVVVCGGGKVGYPLAYHLLVNLHHEVTVYDPAIANIAWPEYLCHEPFVREQAWRQNLRHSACAVTAIQNCDAAFIIVPTPQKGDRLSGDIVRQAIAQVREVNTECLILVVSTLDPREAGEIISRPNIVYTPVFIRLGHVVEDLEKQSFLLLGMHASATAETRKRTEELWGLWETGHTYTDKDGFEVEVTGAWEPAVFQSDPVTIATAKLALNATLSMRVAWANDVAVRAKAFGADPDLVATIIAADPRIGPSHNFPGWPPSGPCLPRDLDCFTSVLGLGLAEVAKIAHYQVHHRIVQQACDDIMAQVGEHPSVLILGATYNPNAQDWTGSLGLALQKECEKRGWEHLVFDPVLIETSFPFTTSEVETERWAMGGKKAVVLCTPWEQCERVFKSIKMTNDTFFGNHMFFDLTWRRKP